MRVILDLTFPISGPHSHGNIKEQKYKERYGRIALGFARGCAIEDREREMEKEESKVIGKREKDDGRGVLNIF